MEAFEIDLVITSQSRDYESVPTSRLEEEGVYGQFRIRVGNNSYGFYDKEIATQTHPLQDDLYYWTESMLKAVNHIADVKNVAIRDIEHRERWVEFVDGGTLTDVSVIDADSSSDLIVTTPLKQKNFVVKFGTVNKAQMVNTILSTANDFLASTTKIEPRFADTDQHKGIIALIANTNKH